MSEARAQHYIPQFLLQNFTLNGREDEHLWVTDPVQRRHWKSLPKETGHQRDFYRVEAEGIDPNIAEKFLSGLESDAAPIFRALIEEQRLPGSDADREILMYFLAFWLARVPSPRRALDRSMDALNRQALKLILETPERWSEFVERWRREGVLAPDDVVDYASMKEFVESGRFTTRLEPNGFHVKMMFHSAEFIRLLLDQRQWGLLFSASGEFICADRPALFVDSATPEHPPGLGYKHTGLLFPVSRHLMVIGSEFESGVAAPLNKKEVAQTNRITLVNTDQHLYSAKEEFPWLDRSGKVRYEMPPMAKDETPAVMDACVKGSPVPEPVIELRERPLKLLA
jgi:hypothetical protein